jgi:pimeloyl-ACP methyl ester carboxylesterase
LAQVDLLPTPLAEDTLSHIMLLNINKLNVFISILNKPIDTSKDSVLFVHGAGQDHTIWRHQANWFARQGRNALAIDLPGHGRSAGDPLPTIEAMAEWLVGLLDAVGLAEAAIVGHSMGALTAVAMAANHPVRVRTIALIGVSVPMPVAPPLLEAARENPARAIDMLNGWGYSEAAQQAGINESGRRLMERARPGVLYRDLLACNEYADGLGHAARVRCPALLILGAEDRLTPARAAQDLTDTLPSTRSVILEGSGHALLDERPDEVLGLLAEVL